MLAASVSKLSALADNVPAVCAEKKDKEGRYKQYTVKSCPSTGASFLQKFKSFFLKLLSCLCCFQFRCLSERKIRKNKASVESRINKKDTDLSKYCDGNSEHFPSDRYKQPLPKPVYLQSSDHHCKLPGRLGNFSNDCYLQSLLYFIALDPELYKKIDELALKYPKDKIVLSLRAVLFSVLNEDDKSARYAYSKFYKAMYHAGYIQGSIQMDAAEVLAALFRHLDTLFGGVGLRNNGFYRYEKYSDRIKRERLDHVLFSEIHEYNPSSFKKYVQNLLSSSSYDDNGNVASDSILFVDSLVPENKVFPCIAISCFEFDRRTGQGRKRLKDIKAMFKKLLVNLTVHVRCAPYLHDKLLSSEQIDNLEKEKRRFRLHRMVLHAGVNVNSGHYVSAVRGTDGCWVVFDKFSRKPISAGDDKAFVAKYIQGYGFTPCLMGYLPFTADGEGQMIATTGSSDEGYASPLQVPLSKAEESPSESLECSISPANSLSTSLRSNQLSSLGSFKSYVHKNIDKLSRMLV